MGNAAGWTAIATCVTAIFIAIGAVFAYRQLKTANTAREDANKTNKLQAMLHVLDLVTRDEAAYASRQWIYENADLLGNPHVFTKEQREHVENVVRAWDRVGWLVNNGLVEPDLIFDMWVGPIVLLYEITRPYIEMKATDGRSNPDGFHNFRTLWDRAWYPPDPPLKVRS